MSNMNDTWHDILSSSSSEESEISVEKEELANNILKMHIPCYPEVTSPMVLKWSIDDYNRDVLVVCTMLTTYFTMTQKLKATNVFKQ
jgi:hypothetical protein